ncbi:O-methyltransferase [Botrimarina hoheduenensis]|uniref:Putative O-methyltransferase n=1 Tax=Botrimarina hoheduenensis TaxID=2528000 RepID=A0A5C5WAN1_9BACT|nr:O-methyltransferase [Botrimarina hoheduenensis]TWT47634.1 putative O-methyltransferase [Botrimarina hoheduenensis]
MSTDPSFAAAMAVDDYLTDTLQAEDGVLAAARHGSAAAGLPDISVSACQAQMLGVLARAVGAKRILEIGVLGGYSTIGLARAVGEGGQVVTLEVDPHHAEVARKNLRHAGLDELVTILLGPALETLPAVAETETPPFDFVFIDADKPNIPAYFEWALRLTRPGSLIVVDNVVRRGELANPASDDPAVLACRELAERLAHEPRIAATIVQTVGAKGHDGFVLATVLNTSSSANR